MAPSWADEVAEDEAKKNAGELGAKAVSDDHTEPDTMSESIVSQMEATAVDGSVNADADLDVDKSEIVSKVGDFLNSMYAGMCATPFGTSVCLPQAGVSSGYKTYPRLLRRDASANDSAVGVRPKLNLSTNSMFFF